MGKKIKEIVDANINFVSFVKKGANGKDFLIVKSSENKPTIEKEVPILKVDKEKRLVTGIVYEPNTIDSQDEFMTEESIEKTAHSFIESHRNIDKNHTFKNEKVSVVESYVTKGETKIGDKDIKKGSWILTTKVHDNDLWEDVKKGNFKGYSMGGTGKRVEHEKTPKGVEKVNKSDNQNNENLESNEQMKGFFNIMKTFFTGGSIEKASTNQSKVSSFADRMAVNDVTEGMWRVNDTLRATMRDILRSSDIKDKPAALNKSIDEFAAYMKSKVKNINSKVTKSDEEFFLSEPNKSTSEEVNEVKKEDLQDILKESLSPIVNRLDKLEDDVEKPNNEENQEDNNITKEDISTSLKEALKPITERLEKVEKARGISKQVNEENEEIQKSTSTFSGIQI